MSLRDPFSGLEWSRVGGTLIGMLGLGVLGCTGAASDDAGGAADAGRVDAGSDVGRSDGGVEVDAGPLPCPTAPPFDADDPRYAACTRPVYLAAGDRFRRAISYDGLTWEASMPPDPGEGDFFFNGAAVGNGILVIVGGRGDSGMGVMTSFDGGATFDVVTDIPHDTFDVYAGTVAFFQGAFWVVANAGTWTSTDGMSWTGWAGDTMLPGGIRGSFGGHGHGWAASETALILVNDDLRYRRFDGTSWSEGVVGGGALMGYFSSIAYGNGRFVTTGQDCCSGAPPETSASGFRSASTDDGLTWPTVLTNGMGAPEFHGTSALWDGTRFYAGGGGYDNHAYTSDDGLTWTAVATDRAIGATLLYEGVWVGVEHGHLDTSTDGRTWTRAYTSPDADAEKWFNVLAAGRVLR